MVAKGFDDQTHKHFGRYKEDYVDLHDFLAGERRIKEQGDRYTPRLEGHRNKPESTYNTYKAFGILYNALHRTRQGLKGAILRKPVDILFPESQKAILDDIMLNGASFGDLARMACDDVLGYGRYGVLVDIDEDEDPYVATYNALSILNWPEIVKAGAPQKIKLAEKIEIPDPDEPGKLKEIQQIRQLELDDKGKYLVTLLREVDGEWVAFQDVENPNPRMPTYKGVRLDYIPFTFFGATSNVPNPSRPPLLDLLYLVKGHWRLTVAYQYGVNFAGLPTPWFAGFVHEDGSTAPLGPGVAYFADDPGATCGFLQTGGEGLASMEHALDRLEGQMAIVGARLLEEQRAGVEAAETVRLRSSGDSATLADIAGNIEHGLTQVLRNIGFWLGIGEKEAQVSVNKDFTSVKASPQDITAWVQALQGGGHVP